jgi:hypothetical protein
VFAFFFGYFFVWLRGSSGIQKAFWMFLAMAVPPAIATGLSANASSWQGLGFWFLQVLITALLLGLFAGDIETLLRSGHSWRRLIDVHNWGALSAWGSALLVAVGTTISTIVLSSFGSLLAAALQYAGLLPAGAKVTPH